MKREPRPSTARPRSSRAFWAYVAPLVALWVLPVAGLALVLPLANQSEQGELKADLPSLVTVGQRFDSHPQSVTIEITLGAAPAVRSQASGILTAVVQPDAALANGAILARVNDVPILAMVSEAPLYRDLRRGDRGNDVKSLGQFLSATGYMSADQIGDRFESSMRSGVRAFQAAIGVPQDGIFRLSYVAFVPPAAGVLSPSDLALGDQISVGDEIFTAEPAPLAVRVLNAAGTVPSIQGRQVVLTAGESNRLEVQTLEPAGDELRELFAWVGLGVESGDLETSTSGDTLTVTNALLQLATPEQVGTVPATAIYLNEAGIACLFAETEGVVRAITLSRFESAAGEIGVIYVEPGLTGTTVVRDPLQLGIEVRDTCD